MAGKSLLHYFKPKEVLSPAPASLDSQSDTNTSATPPTPPDVVEIQEEFHTSESEIEVVPQPTAAVRRSARASANRARQAWNHDSSSSDSDEDFKRGTRKRGRPSKSKRSSNERGKQATLSVNGTLVKKEEKNNNKKKVKYDPEREAFLRSGVPDVIAKARSKPSEKGKNKEKQKVEEDEPPEPKRRQLDPETLAFLQSGVPDSVAKVQQAVDKRKEETDALCNMGLFPKTSHTCNFEKDVEESVKEGVPLRFTLKTPINEAEETFGISPSSDFSCLSSIDQKQFSPVGLCCSGDPVRVISKEKRREKINMKNLKTSENDCDVRPWIEKMKVTDVKNLVVDKHGLETLMKWLKQWKADIKDDGGTSRKMEPKKKRGNSSDSDFITSDEEDSAMKKKSVLITGPSGCAKTAAVYVLSKHYGFEVEEVNFSSRRPGKEVLQRVEEAVLSHRLKSSNNCLLLFKDIDLLHPDEDEGFFSAVAQLITTAVRPIVMTSCLPSYCTIDAKLDRKDPLRISFSLPKPGEIVEKILKPILVSANTKLKSENTQQIDRWLDSIVRHAGCDIRQSINQLQMLLSTSSPGYTYSLSNQDIHLHSSPFQPHLVDLNFPRQASQNSQSEDDDELNLSLNARKKRAIKELTSVATSLELFGDLDFVSRLSTATSTSNVNIFGDIDEASWYWNHVSGMKNPFFSRLSYLLSPKGENSVDVQRLNELVLESDAEIDKWMEIDGINDEVSQYCDRNVGGQDWESCAAVRTIVKNNMVDTAVGRTQKRNGRQASYFNRLDRGLVTKITETLGFQEHLSNMKTKS